MNRAIKLACSIDFHSTRFIRVNVNRLSLRGVSSMGQFQSPSQFQWRRSKFLIGRHVREAMANDEPIVALESTVITHGLPEPENLALALELEREISNWRPANNATCFVTGATVGLIKGQLIVGLSRDELEFLANKSLSRPMKASRRDIPVAMALGRSAGTTVAATMAAAVSCQPKAIKVFATGGLGGVHLGGELSMDISADLYEFARSPMGVVSAGFKSFLDTRRSLELLETFGCTVMSLASARSQTRASSSCSFHKSPQAKPAFPGFYSAINRQKAKSPLGVANVCEAASILIHCLEAPLAERRGALLAVPIPNEFSLEEDSETMELVRAIEGRSDLEGSQKTPLILEQLNLATKGKTLKANIELLKNNARVGAQLALEYNKLLMTTFNIGASINELNISRPKDNEVPLNQANSMQTSNIANKNQDQANKNDIAYASAGTSAGAERPSAVVVGCTMIDMHVSTKVDDRFKMNPIHSGVTFPGRPHLTVGGVGRNLATALQFLGHQPTFITSLARDNLADFALVDFRLCTFRDNQLKINWINRDFKQQTNNDMYQNDHLSSCFALVLMDSISGQCEFVIANLDAVNSIDRNFINTHKDLIQQSPLLVIDTNLTSSTIEHLIEICYSAKVPLFLEPTDVAALPNLVLAIKNLSLSHKSSLNSLLCMSPNLIELCKLIELFENQIFEEKEINLDAITIEQIEIMAKSLLEKHIPQLKCLLVTLAERGTLVAARLEPGECLADMKLMEKSCRPSPSFLSSTIQMSHFRTPQEPIEKPVSASGAGDSFAAGFISGLLNGHKISQCLELAFEASAMALKDKNTISGKLVNLNRRKQTKDNQ